jgi:alpha-beta hydrolase superfamily lysophospholipase
LITKRDLADPLPVTIIANTYWGGAPYHFRGKVDADVEPLLLKAPDFREFHGLYWTPRGNSRPKVAVVAMHPRVDFSRHYTFPRLLERGVGCLGALTRNPNNDVDTVHEEIILDVAACVRFLKERRGAERVILIGNSGGGSLNALFQQQATRPSEARIAVAPGGLPTRLRKTDLVPADGLVYLSAHRGEGHVLMQCIDPSVVDEVDPVKTDDALDMYAPENGFREPPAWSRYAPEFLARFRAAQAARVERLDAIAQAKMDVVLDAIGKTEATDFAERPEPERRALLRARHLEEVMVVYRTMANPNYVDATLDPSGREYGSLLSHRPDLMNHKLLGFGRICTPRAWLSTWSGTRSNADLVKTLPEIREPTLVVHAGRDKEIYREGDARPIFEAVGAADKTFLEIEHARHYFEPDFGQRESPAVEELMDHVVPWIEERFA